MDVGDVSGKRTRPRQDEAHEHASRQRRKTEPEAPSATPPETEYRILCPASKIGSLIGKGGSIIKTFRQECRSKIRVEDPIQGSDERIIYICSSAKDFRTDHNSDTQSVCAAQEALFRVHDRIVEISGAEEDDDEPPRPITARLIVPNAQIGCILGKGGKIIEQMRREIGAQIRVLPKEQIPHWVSGTDEMVQLSGDLALVKKALKAVSTRLYENPPRNRGAGTSMETFYGGTEVYPSGGFVPQGGPFIPHPPMGGSMMGFGGYPGYGTMWPAAVPSPFGSGPVRAPGAAEAAVEGELVVRILCPNDKIGSMIGKGGSIIRKMRECTGAAIKVGDPVPTSNERIIEIASPEYIDSVASPAVEATLQVHNRLVELLSDKDRDINNCMCRLLVHASQIGCILGKGGSIITELRKTTKANIRIPPKEELPKCASENDELVQITGDENIVFNALVQVLSRLRNNIFRGRDAGHGGSLPMPVVAYAGSASMLPNYGVRQEKGSLGNPYPAGSYGTEYSEYQAEQGSGAKSGNEPRRRQ